METNVARNYVEEYVAMHSKDTSQAQFKQTQDCSKQCQKYMNAQIVAPLVKLYVSLLASFEFSLCSFFILSLFMFLCIFPMANTSNKEQYNENSKNDTNYEYYEQPV